MNRSKCLCLCMIQVASAKECVALKAWIPDLVNHFWKSAELAGSDPILFKVGISCNWFLFIKLR